MKISGRQPRFLPDVMQAIVDLKDGGGSTQSKILEHIQSIINSKKITPKPRNVTMQIRRALKHGVHNGLIKQRGGKFQLGIHPRDFALFKTFRYMEPLKDCSKCKKGRKKRRGKRRRRSRRRRRGRRRTVKKCFSQSESDISKKSETPEPMECTKERKNIRRGGSYARSSKASSGTDQRSRSHRSSKGSIPSQRGQRQYDNDDNQKDYEHCDHEVDRGDHQNYDSYVN